MTDNARLIDSNERGEKLYSVLVEMSGDVISVYVDEDGIEHFPTDFQGEQAKSLEEVSSFDWVLGEEICF